MAIEEHVRVREVEDAGIAAAMFQHRYREAIPSFPHHIVAWCRGRDGEWLPAAYVHGTASGDFLLGGGACVDNRALRQLDADARSAVHEAGGLYRHMLSWAIDHFSDRYLAIFGYCGDALAERIDLAAGFSRTPHPHLLAIFKDTVSAQMRAELIAQAHAIGPF